MFIQIRQMKNVKLTLNLLLLFSSVFLTNCTPELPYVSTTKEIIVQGSWNVQYYFDGQDNTAQYYNFQFTFSNDGTVVCTKGADNYTGSWSLIKDASHKDVIHFAMDTQDAALTALNVDWTVTTVNLRNIAMKNENSVQLVMAKL